MAKPMEGEAQGDDRVHGPGVQSPVKKRETHRDGPRFWCLWHSPRGISVVEQGLCYTKEEEPDAHAGAEQHGQPRQPTELRLVGRAPQDNTALSTPRKNKGKNKRDEHSTVKEPPQTMDDEICRAAKNSSCSLGN